MESKHIRIDKDLHPKVKARSALDGKGIQEWVSEVLREELERREREDKKR